MPDIFRGIHLDPLRPGQQLLPALDDPRLPGRHQRADREPGRLGDMYGRVRMYNLGFVIYTVASLLLAMDWMTGRAGASYLIAFRIVQGVGGGLPAGQLGCDHHRRVPAQPARHGARNQQHRRGQRRVRRPRARRPARPDQLAARSSSSRFPSASSAPSGRTASSRSAATPRRASMDWWGNLTFALGLVLRDDRRHLRHPALRRALDGLGEPARARAARRRRRSRWPRSW